MPVVWLAVNAEQAYQIGGGGLLLVSFTVVLLRLQTAIAAWNASRDMSATQVNEAQQQMWADRADWHKARGDMTREWFTKTLADQETILDLQRQVSSCLEREASTLLREADQRERIARLEAQQEGASKVVDALHTAVAMSPRRKSDVAEDLSPPSET